jgi:hypothetical protein
MIDKQIYHLIGKRVRYQKIKINDQNPPHTKVWGFRGFWASRKEN